MRGVLKLLRGQHPEMKVRACFVCPKLGLQSAMRAKCIHPRQFSLAFIGHAHGQLAHVCRLQTKAVPRTPKVHQQNGVSTRNSNMRNGELRFDVADSRTRSKVA